MSTSSRSSKTSKTKSVTKSKSAPKAAAKAKSAVAPTKSRLAGPKPPKARATATKTAAPPASARPGVAATKRPSTSKIPAPPAPKASKPLPVELKKPELIDMVVAKSDVKKKYAKPVVEALLEVLGETIAKGREMNLQPMGKVKYNRTKETTSARVVVTKVRQNKPAKSSAPAPNAPLSDAAE